MRILTLTTLFPSREQPVHGLFIKARMEVFTRKFGHEWVVVAPVPYFPRLPWKTDSLYSRYSRVPMQENLGSTPVYHPRYLVTPKLGMRFYGDWMARGVRKLVRRLHQEKPFDLIDGHYIYPDGTAAIAMGRELGIPVILSARGTDLNLYPGIPAIRPILQTNLAAAKHVICVCSDLATVARELGAPGNKVSVIGNGVDTDRFQPRDRMEARKRLGLPLDKTLLLSVGHLVERKGFHILIGAMAQLKNPDAFLIIAGDGDEMSRLKAQATSLGVADRVLFPGAVRNESLPDWYAASDFFLLASSREGWPNVVCEAQAMGLPVVATKVWGIPEIVQDQQTGLLVDERTEEAFAAAMGEALQLSWNRNEIAEIGQSRTWDDVADKMVPIFGK
jgi:teichuronic acid biosynthesis glycosyltransferase TuaC